MWVDPFPKHRGRLSDHSLGMGPVSVNKGENDGAVNLSEVVFGLEPFWWVDDGQPTADRVGAHLL